MHHITNRGKLAGVNRQVNRSMYISFFQTKVNIKEFTDQILGFSRPFKAPHVFPVLLHLIYGGLWLGRRIADREARSSSLTGCTCSAVLERSSPPPKYTKDVKGLLW